MMEKLYRKKSNGRYEEIGYGFNNEMRDGIWMVQSKPYSRTITSLAWLIGDIKDPVDVTKHVALQTLRDDLSKYINKLSDGNSEEFKEIKEQLGNYITGNEGIVVNNISNNDLSMLILRKIASLIDE